MTKSSVPKWLRIAIPTVLIGIWLTLGGIGGPYFGRVEEVSDVDLTAFLPASAEATKVNDELKKFRDEKTLPAIVIFESRQGELDETQLTHLKVAGQKLESLDGVAGSVAPPIRSEDKKAAFTVVPINSGSDINEVVGELQASLDKSDLGNTNYKITGPAGFASDLTTAFGGIDGILLLTALAVVFVILIIVYRSVILPIVVLMTSIFALSAGIFIVWQLAKANIIELNGQVQGILFILVIGAATDYSLLYVSRYREALYEHKERFDATRAALNGAFEPILASGGTVIVGLLCLLLSDLASNKALGPVGSIGVAMAMLAALTFLPAVLYAFGRASFWPVRPLATKAAAAAHKAKLRKSFWHKVGGLVDRRPRAVWILSTVVLLAAAFFVTQIRAEGVAQSDLILGSSNARDGQAMLDKHFPGGSGSPALIIIGRGSLDDAVKKIDNLQGIDGVSAYASNVDAGFKPLGSSEAGIRNEIRQAIQKDLDSKKAELEETFARLEATAGPSVAAQAREQAMANLPTADSLVDSAYPFKDAVIKEVDGKVLLQATLSDTPDSDAAKQTIVILRDAVKGIDPAAIVGGNTAVQLDTNTASLRDRAIIIPVVLAAITIILMLLLRAIVAPILLLLSTVVSFAASLGVAALLFNHVWSFPGADPSVVLYAFVFLVALGIDYNIFLMTRVREETLKHGTAEGVIKGLVVTGGVITSAGIVLAATFAALGVIPILFLFQLAFIVAFGVLLDTFLVRSLLVPALIRDIGPFVWWPSKLRHKA